MFFIEERLHTARYLVLLWVTNSQKSKRRNDKVVNSPETSREGTFDVHMFIESVCIVFQK